MTDWQIVGEIDGLLKIGVPGSMVYYAVSPPASHAEDLCRRLNDLTAERDAAAAEVERLRRLEAWARTVIQHWETDPYAQGMSIAPVQLADTLRALLEEGKPDEQV